MEGVWLIIDRTYETMITTYLAPLYTVNFDTAGEFSNHSQGRIERSGIGTHCFANGMEYFGAWVKDKMCGNGTNFIVLYPLY